MKLYLFEVELIYIRLVKCKAKWSSHLDSAHTHIYIYIITVYKYIFKKNTYRDTRMPNSYINEPPRFFNFKTSQELYNRGLPKPPNLRPTSRSCPSTLQHRLTTCFFSALGKIGGSVFWFLLTKIWNRWLNVCGTTGLCRYWKDHMVWWWFFSSLEWFFSSIGCDWMRRPVR